AAVATDRRRAEWLLLAVTGAATLSAFITLAFKIGVFTFFGATDREHANIIAADGASLGIIFATAAALQLSENGKARQSDHGKSTLPIWSPVSACLIALGTCVAAVAVQAAPQIYIPAFCGLAMFGVAIMIRRFNLGPWGISAIVSIFLFVA